MTKSHASKVLKGNVQDVGSYDIRIVFSPKVRDKFAKLETDIAWAQSNWDEKIAGQKPFDDKLILKVHDLADGKAQSLPKVIGDIYELAKAAKKWYIVCCTIGNREGPEFSLHEAMHEMWLEGERAITVTKTAKQQR